MKENYGAFNRSNYYFSPNRQNNKFQQKGLVFDLKKGKMKNIYSSLWIDVSKQCILDRETSNMQKSNVSLFI